MKSEITNKGWKETTVKYFTIISFHKNPFNTTVEEWIKYNTKLRLVSDTRTNCRCCHKPWKKLEGYLNCVMTNNGNMAVCDNCFEKLSERSKYEPNQQSDGE